MKSDQEKLESKQVRLGSCQKRLDSEQEKPGGKKMRMALESD